MPASHLTIQSLKRERDGQMKMISSTGTMTTPRDAMSRVLIS